MHANRERAERRRAHRTQTSLGVEVSGFSSGEEGGVLRTQSLNLSAEGVYCTVSRFIPPLTRVRLALILPADSALGGSEERTVHCDAVVVRSYPEREARGCSSYEVACYFTAMDEEDRQLLTDHLAVGTTR